MIDPEIHDGVPCNHCLQINVVSRIIAQMSLTVTVF